MKFEWSKIQVIERSVLRGTGFGTGHDGFSYADRNNRAGREYGVWKEVGDRLVVTSVESFPETRPMCRKKKNGD